MSNNTAIQIYLRVRPTKRIYSGMTVIPDNSKLEFHLPKDKSAGYVNNQRENYNFEFDHLFGMDAKQETVFDDCAKEVVDSCLEGYNGTIFAYGQTGSGKTYTMTGGAERYVDRGIIPRTLAYIYSEAKKRTDSFFKISVSYIEIYNNDGYDLLDENHTTKNLSDLPKVIPRETEDERIILSGLSVHKAENEEQALNLLFIGETNRVVCETPKNDASTRSHCIFIIQLEATKAGSDVKTVSRLHLVDLSGSERIGKTGVDGKLANEARYINLSLHYLEHVIICLNKKSKGEDIHVPYRNSLMTLVLRDSLGGNCKTRMIATVSAEESDIDESISTCNFAQRVALIKNRVSRNEAVDPALIIERLKKENAELRAELALARGGNNKTSLDQTEVEECKKIVEDYVKTSDPSVKIVLTDMIKINECFYHFKHLFNDLSRKFEKASSQAGTAKIMNGLGVKDTGPDIGQLEEVKRLKLLIAQRDQEIMILLNAINNSKNSNQQSLIPVDGGDDTKSMIISTSREENYKPLAFPQFQAALEKQQANDKENNGAQTPKRINYEEINNPMTVVQKKLRGESTSSYGSESTKGNSLTSKPSDTYSTNNKMNETVSKEVEEVNGMLINPLNLTNEQLMDRAACFEMFRKSYRKNQALEENKELLKDKYNRGKELGTVVNNSRNKINMLKNQIEELRKENALMGLVTNQNEIRKHPDEDKLTDEIERQKKIYKDGFDDLKDLKSEIERIQNTLERNRDRMQKDFEKWVEVMLNQKAALVSASPNPKSMNNPSSTTGSNILASTQRTNAGNPNDTSVISGISQVTTATNLDKTVDPMVKRNLAAFYKARDEIYSSISSQNNNS